MPRKQSDKTYGEKLLWLFAELYFKGRPRSLIDLAKEMDCSKQTVIRMVNNISRAYIPIEETKEGRRSYYQIPRVDKPKALSMSPSELTLLQMCQTFTKHLLGEDLILESEKAIQKSSALAPGTTGKDCFAVFLPGTIDYTPRQNDIRLLMKAMEEKKVCEIIYKNPFQQKGKTFYVKPYKLFAYNNALYLHSGMSGYPGSRKSQFEFDPLLAVHRLEKVTLTERKFQFPANYNFEKHFNQAFGIIKQKAFKVKLELTGFAAAFALERRLSPDQRFQKLKDGVVKLSFTASSALEVKGWVLSLGEEVKVLSPGWLVNDIKDAIQGITRRYGMDNG